MAVDGAIDKTGLICLIVIIVLNTKMWLLPGNKKRNKRDYWESGEGVGKGEVLTLSKLANRSASRALWRGGEEGAKGSDKGSLAGREEEEKSAEGCGRKCPRLWKESEVSVLEMDDLLPEKTDRDICQYKCPEKEWTKQVNITNYKRTGQAWTNNF